MWLPLFSLTNRKTVGRRGFGSGTEERSGVSLGCGKYEMFIRYPSGDIK